MSYGPYSYPSYGSYSSRAQPSSGYSSPYSSTPRPTLPYSGNRNISGSSLSKPHTFGGKTASYYPTSTSRSYGSRYKPGMYLTTDVIASPSHPSGGYRLSSSKSASSLPSAGSQGFAMTYVSSLVPNFD